MAKGRGRFYGDQEDDEEEKVEDKNPKSNTDNKPNSKIKNNPKPKDNPNHNPINNSKYEKVKYTDTRTQRAFYYDKFLIKIFDKEYPKSRFDKSQIMNDLLRKFLEENGKL
jgi:hypothetical protein